MIEKLFTSKNRTKLLEYFIFRKQSGRLREIAIKQAEMFVQNTRKSEIFCVLKIFDFHEIRTSVQKIRTLNK